MRAIEGHVSQCQATNSTAKPYLHAANPQGKADTQVMTMRPLGMENSVGY